MVIRLPATTKGEVAMAKTNMAIYRASTARQMTGEDGHFEAPPSGTVNGWGLLFDAGLADGTVAKMLLDLPGFSLVYNWFKPHFPLPRHSHNVDCLYYIVSGSLRLGSEDLGPGDGFFIAADTPYFYTIGADGLEILEFRHKAFFTTRGIAASQAYWDKALASVAANRDSWKAMIPPRPAA
jgi:hypothetical protein